MDYDNEKEYSDVFNYLYQYYSELLIITNHNYIYIRCDRFVLLFVMRSVSGGGGGGVSAMSNLKKMGALFVNFTLENPDDSALTRTSRININISFALLTFIFFFFGVSIIVSSLQIIRSCAASLCTHIVPSCPFA